MCGRVSQFESGEQERVGQEGTKVLVRTYDIRILSMSLRKSS